MGPTPLALRRSPASDSKLLLTRKQVCYDTGRAPSSHRPHYPSMPYKYTPVSRRAPGPSPPSYPLTPLTFPFPFPLPFPLPPTPLHPTCADFPLGMTATPTTSPVNHRLISQKRPRAQTLVLAVPTRPPLPPSAPITPHPSSYSHSQHVVQCQQPQPHPYSQPQASGPGSAPGSIAPSHSSLSSLLSAHHNHDHYL